VRSARATAVVTASPDARPRLRDDRARETRRRLVTAAVELAAEHGWRGATVERIAARAGVAKGTFFVHFKTKEAIVLALVHHQIAAAAAARDAAVEAGTPVDGLRAATMTLGAEAASNIEVSRAVLIAILESREIGGATDEVFSTLRARMVGDARDALARGLLHGPDAETVAGLLMACYLGAALHCTSAPRARPLVEVLGPLVDATMAALTRPADETPRRRGAKSRDDRATARARGARS
jgi:AcrR family transcriptional regulator